MKLTLVLLMIVSAVSLFGCGHKPPAGTAPSTTPVNMPDWYASPPHNQDYLYATATSMSRDRQLAIDKATQRANLDLASRISARFEDLTKKFDEEAKFSEDPGLTNDFSRITKSLVSMTLRAPTIKNQDIQVEGTIYRAYILMELPLGPYNIALLEKINANQGLRDRLASTRTYNELAKEAEKYKQQNQGQSDLR